MCAAWCAAAPAVAGSPPFKEKNLVTGAERRHNLACACVRVCVCAPCPVHQVAHRPAGSRLRRCSGHSSEGTHQDGCGEGGGKGGGKGGESPKIHKTSDS